METSWYFIATKFRYTGATIETNGGIDLDVTKRMGVGWAKSRQANGLLHDKRILCRLKRRRPLGRLCCMELSGGQLKKRVNKVMVTEMHIPTWMSRLRNEIITDTLRVAPIDEKIRKNRLRWFGHVHKRPKTAPVRKVGDRIRVERTRSRGRPLKLGWKR